MYVTHQILSVHVIAYCSFLHNLWVIALLKVGFFCLIFVLSCVVVVLFCFVLFQLSIQKRFQNLKAGNQI